MPDITNITLKDIADKDKKQWNLHRFVCETLHRSFWRMESADIQPPQQKDWRYERWCGQCGRQWTENVHAEQIGPDRVPRY
jgi:hypothetical protein